MWSGWISFLTYLCELATLSSANGGAVRKNVKMNVQKIGILKLNPRWKKV